jgi:hypothetical protein
MQQFHKFITWCLCVAQHISGVSPLIIRSINCIRGLWFYRWRKAAEPLWVVVCRRRPTTLQPIRSNGKTRGSKCSCMLLIKGGETSETCWATHKRQVINLWNCCILLVDLFESNWENVFQLFVSYSDLMAYRLAVGCLTIFNFYTLIHHYCSIDRRVIHLL